MRILVVTSCTGAKVVEHERSLKRDDFRRGKKHVASRERELSDLLIPAEQLYNGQQHVRLMRGVSAFRKIGTADRKSNRLDLWVLSAGYGLVPGDRQLAPYECTFSGMAAEELSSWGDELNVPKDFRRLLAEPFDVAILLLGEEYLAACKLEPKLVLGGPTLLICGTTVAKKLPRIPNLRSLALTNADATRFHCGQVGLKGEVAGRILVGLADGSISPSLALQGGSGLVDALASSPNSILACGAVRPARQRFTVFLPRARARTLYFIPEWDDRVDPAYDFSIDKVTPERDPYSHDVYAHEIYESPNYDGILVSKSVIDQNAKKRARIQRTGIHAHVRVPRNFPVMGDCGAFNYIDAELPPYSTDETVRYYQSLDFDYGVSVDHLILPQHLEREVHFSVEADGSERRISAAEYEKLGDEGVVVLDRPPSSRSLFAGDRGLFVRRVPDLSEAKRRWEITLRNAKDFITAHRAHGCTFTPVAGCQGWDTDSQCEMFRQQQEMGYRYIALGGLVRSPTSEILQVLEAVNRIRKPDTKVHLFGVARPEAMRQFMDAGVNSVDSARFLRQAWLSALSNYYAGDVGEYAESLRSSSNGAADDEEDGPSRWRYAALRIPPVFREESTTPNAKAKKLLDDGYDLRSLLREEQQVLDIVHEYDRGHVSLDEALDAVVAYDQLMGGDKRNKPHYRRTLEDRPWKQCPCAVCRQTGIDVVIFRRNNRNRRRGFHNTWWFFSFFRRIAAEQR